MKQTAVEWLYDQLEFDDSISMDDIEKIFNQAKEIEKEQHQQTFNQARLTKIFEKDMPPVWDSWYQYYNITFKSE